MAYETLTRSLRDASLVIKDDSANQITVSTDEGDLTWTENIDVKEIIQRGVIKHALAGNEQACDVSFTTRFTELIGVSSEEAPYAALHNIVPADGWVSHARDAAEVYQVQLIFTVNTPMASPGVGDVDYETITFAYFYVTTLTFTEGDDYSTLAVTGRDFETRPTIVRTAGT